MAENIQTTQTQDYVRFTPSQRMQHLVLIVTFSGLGLTGLAQTFSDQAWAQAIIALFGGVESIRIVHRVLATVLMVTAIYHGGIITYKLFVLGRQASIMPGLRDVRDAWQWVMYNLGFRGEHPHMPRYNFGEKVEYFAVVWGTILMVITGFMMWNPIATTRFLPGEFIPAARSAHRYEALLAVLSIIIWHMYNVHIRRFNRSMFSGKIRRDAMEEEHAQELEDIEEGKVAFEYPPEVINRRKRYFWPYAVIVTIILTGGLIFFVTFEETAITTLPQRQEVVTTDLDPSIGVVEEGAVLWTEQGCDVCHGANADGSESPLEVSIIDRDVTFEQFIITVRRGPAEMPAYPIARLSDEGIAHLWAWFVDTQEQAAPAETEAAPTE
ncbi:MAG: cytochrome b/b6 domain-containing protein [Anaerolineae bacterium]|nr:cytochrome b/b6 domain-containing protein [Anaerolineae bacterium]